MRRAERWAGVTKTEAISLAHGHSIRLSEALFERLVASGQAPAPIGRVGGQPLWDRNAIRKWSLECLPGQLEKEAEELLFVQSRDVSVEEVPRLECLELDATIPSHLAVCLAERHLTRLLGELSDGRAAVRRGIESLRSDPNSEEPSKRRLFEKRKSSSAEQLIDLEHRLGRLDKHEEAINRDLTRCRAWLHHLFRWAESEKRSRLTRIVEECQIAAEERERAVDFGALEICSTAEFARGDERRVGRWPEGTDGFVHLSGMDFFDYWRLDQTDSFPMSGRPGSWRVSWILKTGELYACEWHRDMVFVIGVVESSERAMERWMEPLERRCNERNSLGMVMAAFREQQAAGFPSLLAEGEDYF